MTVAQAIHIRLVTIFLANYLDELCEIRINLNQIMVIINCVRRN